MPLIDLANPPRFMQLARVRVPAFAAIAAALLAVGLYLGFRAPADALQGEAARIMYIHVPSAWLALGIYTLMAIAALGTLVWRHPLAAGAGEAAAPPAAACGRGWL